jgi:predicted nucleic acid-binding protein
MAYLLDTNVISEVRKGDRCNRGVLEFFDHTDDSELFLPVQVIGEIRAGIAKAMRKKDRRKAEVYEQWLDILLQEYGDRIIEFDTDCAQIWGTLLSGEKKDPHTVDKQIAAIAITRDMTLVTRDTGGGFTTIADRDLKVFNPFKTEPTARISPSALRTGPVPGRRHYGHDPLFLTELDPNTVVHHPDGEDAPVVLATFGNVREACPNCGHNALKLVLRQQNVRFAHLFCAECHSCFDAHYANGAPALTI